MLQINGGGKHRKTHRRRRRKGEEAEENSPELKKKTLGAIRLPPEAISLKPKTARDFLLRFG
ncbi:hypothetical protein TIFTF001_026687 [Ficus carica]|uniref:Uncharacterized protein n=1 Tax=Ficus carica TaxID=3494 RepID=A0AA88DLM9_FICCA|nr:hypothetical protein TIFTF001_026687 [Ficus carica]